MTIVDLVARRFTRGFHRWPGTGSRGLPDGLPGFHENRIIGFRGDPQGRTRHSLRVCGVSTLCLPIFLASCASGTPPQPEGGALAAIAAESRSATIARRTGFATADDGTRLYFEVSGSGPAMVFVHGLGGNHAVWFQQTAHFAADHTVVTVSQRGFAPSGGDGTRYDVGVLVDDLEAVMDAAGVARAAVIGQSLGGWTALGLALESPSRVSALVLTDTFAGIQNDGISRHLRGMTEQASRLRASPPPLGIHPALSAEFSRRRPDLACLYQALTTFGAPSPDVIAKQLAGVRVSPEALRRMEVPTLFVVGADDTIFPPNLVKKASTFVPKARLLVVEGAGHSPYFERADTWNAEVRRFVDRP